MGDLMGAGVLLAKGILIVLSVISVAVVGERAWILRGKRRAEEKDYAALRDAIEQEETPTLDALRLRVNESRAPSLRALAMGLPASSEERMQSAVGQGIAIQTAQLQNNLPLLATIASTAPYIGLFGTVLGILSAFRQIARTGDTGASVVASGISEALITTALGLAVAVPAVMAYNYFVKRTSDFGLLVETHALDLTGRVADLQQERAEAIRS